MDCVKLADGNRTNVPASHTIVAWLLGCPWQCFQRCFGQGGQPEVQDFFLRDQGGSPPLGVQFFRAFGAIFIQHGVLSIHLEALWNDLPPEADFFALLTSQIRFSKGKTVLFDFKL